jgi:hypothetical protein
VGPEAAGDAEDTVAVGVEVAAGAEDTVAAGAGDTAEDTEVAEAATATEDFASPVNSCFRSFGLRVQ